MPRQPLKLQSSVEVDEARNESRQLLQRQWDENADLEAAVKAEEVKLWVQSNAFFRKKTVNKIRSLRKDLTMEMGTS